MSLQSASLSACKGSPIKSSWLRPLYDHPHISQTPIPAPSRLISLESEKANMFPVFASVITYLYVRFSAGVSWKTTIGSGFPSTQMLTANSPSIRNVPPWLAAVVASTSIPIVPASGVQINVVPSASEGLEVLPSLANTFW